MDALLCIRLTIERVMACETELGALLTDYRQAFVTTSAQVMDASMKEAGALRQDSSQIVECLRLRA